MSAPHLFPAPAQPGDRRLTAHTALSRAIHEHGLKYLTIGYGERHGITDADQAYRLYLDAIYAGDDVCLQNHDGSVSLREHDL